MKAIIGKNAEFVGIEVKGAYLMGEIMLDVEIGEFTTREFGEVKLVRLRERCSPAKALKMHFRYNPEMHGNPIEFLNEYFKNCLFIIDINL